MAGSKGDVELVIRAKNEASKNLDAVNKSLKALTDQQTLAGNTAGTAQGKFAQLGQQLQQLKTNAANLKSLSSIATVLDAATGALDRLRAGAADTGSALQSLQQRQSQLAASSVTAADAAKATAEAVKVEDAAYKAALKSVRDLGSESTKLANTEKSTQASLTSSSDAIAKLSARLAEAVTKQKAAAEAVDSSEKATKRQIASLDSANAALVRRQTALDNAKAKETALRDTLESTQAALVRNKAAQETANAALTAQAKVVADARAANAAAAAAVTNLGTAQRAVATDIASATKAYDGSVAALKAAEAEYANLKTVADAARTAVGANAPTTDAAGAAAGRAAVQVAVLAARLAALNAAGGAKTGALGIDPAAIRTADGDVKQFGVTIRLAANEATKASVTVDQLSAAITGLGQTKNQLTGLADTLTKQQQAVAGAEAAWRAAREEQLRLAAALKASEAPSDALAAGLGRAQAAARLAWDAFKAERTAADDMTAALGRAGVGSGTFASAQASLADRIKGIDDQIKSGNQSLSALPGVLNNAGNSASTATPKVNGLRTAMAGLLGAVNGLASKTNPLSGLTSSITGAVTAAVGLYGIKDQLEKIIDAGLELEGNKSRFTAAFGSIEKGNAELDYARTVATNLKLPINDLAKGYSNLALAAKNTSLEGEGARKIFEAFAQASRVNQTSTANLEGVFTALTQILSKGKVQAEELRQQLGDRLPGALQTLADGLGISVQELDKLMSQGKLTRDVLLNMAQQVSTNVAPALVAALNSPAAKIQDFNNRITVLRENIAESGFLQAFADGLEKIGSALSTPEALQGARDLGQALADLIKWLAQAPEHFDAIVTSIQALGVAWVALQITSIVSGFISFTAAVGGLTIAVSALDIALAPVIVGLGALAAVVATVVGAFALWKLAQWAYDNFPAFAEGVQNVKLAALDAWDGIITAWEIAAAQLKASFGGAMGRIRDMWYSTLNDILKFAPNLTEKLGLGNLADEIEKQAKDAAAAAAGVEQSLQNEIDSIKKKGLERQAQNAKNTEDAIYEYHRKRITDAMTEDDKLRAAQVSKQLTSTLGQTNKLQFPGAPDVQDVPLGTGRVTGAPAFVPDDTAERERAAKKAAAARLALEKSVAEQMFTIRSQLEKKSADSLDEQIAAVPAKYASLLAKLKALGKGAGDADYESVQQLIKQEQELLKVNDVKKKQAEADKLSRQIEAAENAKQLAIQQGITALVEERKDIQLQMSQALEAGDGETYDKLREQLKGVNVELTTTLDAAREYWAAFGGPEADAAIAKIDKMKTSLIQVKDGAILTGFTIGKALGSNLKNAGDEFIDKVIATGNVFKSLKEAFLDFAQSFLTQIAKMILQQIIFNAVKAGLSSFGGGGTIGAGIGQGLGGSGAAQAHNGGTVGFTTQRRTGLNPAVFANAVKYHGGGEAGATGLRSNEVATVLEKGEVVRTEAQEAALQNNQNAGGASQAPQNIKVVNAIDSHSILEDALSSPQGEKLIMNVLKANQRNVRVIAGTK